MDLLQSLIVPRQHPNAVPAVDDIRHEQEEAPALLTTPKPTTNGHKDGVGQHEKLASSSIINTDNELYTTVSLEEFQEAYAKSKAEAERRAEVARKADIDARIVSRSSPAQQLPLQYKSSNAVVGQVTNGTARPLKPLALGKPRTSDHIIALHQLVNKCRLPVPHYEYSENGVIGAGTFSVELRLAVPTVVTVGRQDASTPSEVVLQDLGPFRSKKEAKEVISEKGVVVLKDKIAEAEEAQKAVDEASAQAGATEQKDEEVAPAATAPPLTLKPRPTPSENPIGLLLGKPLCTTFSFPNTDEHIQNTAPPNRSLSPAISSTN